MEKIIGRDATVLSDEFGFLDDRTSLVKGQINRVFQNISAFSQEMEAARNYIDFERVKKEINDFLMFVFEDALKGKSADFVLGFEQSNISKYQTKHEVEKVELIRLLALKNKFYTETLRNITSLGKLDAILKPEEKEDLLNMIESGVFSFLDDVYVEWYANVYNGENEGIKNGKLVYGGVKDGEIVPLKSLSEKEIVIDDEKLSNIHNDHIRSYLLAFSHFIKEGITDYDSWVDAEISEVKSWQDRNSIFGLVAPMEDYIYPRLLIEPELMVFLRNLDKKVDFEDFYGLSEEYFGERYGMDHMTLDFVETLLQTGHSSCSGFIGKAFPNDTELSEREGNCILLKDTKMKETVMNAKKGLKALLGDDFQIDDEKLYNELIKEVTYHEFGHSLFVKGHGDSLLEEAKATLFYYLQIFRENKIVPYTENDITRVVEFTIMDSIRNLERINQSSSKKYVILTKLNLSLLYSSSLIYWENDRLVIDANMVKFEIFLSAMKDMLDYIKNLYSLEEQDRSVEESRFLTNLEVQVQGNIARMIGVLNNPL
ncbi:MAG: hypothetical protein PHH16_04085 [Candidatus Gracilibacteria bacterium]|nr:hypothetical protein [Candidatus Gracilibacteria bacterium]